MEKSTKSLLIAARTTGLRSTKKSAKACKYGKSTKKSANGTVLEIYKKVC